MKPATCLMGPTEVHAMKERRKMIGLTWYQKKAIALALQSGSATAIELSEWSGCNLHTILAIGAAPEFSKAGCLK